MQAWDPGFLDGLGFWGSTLMMNLGEGRVSLGRRLMGQSHIPVKNPGGGRVQGSGTRVRNSAALGAGGLATTLTCGCSGLCTCQPPRSGGQIGGSTGCTARSEMPGGDAKCGMCGTTFPPPRFRRRGPWFFPGVFFGGSAGSGSWRFQTGRGLGSE